MKSSKGADLLNLCATNKYNRFVFWDIFFRSDKGPEFTALQYFWKLQLQLGRSSSAVEQFISRVHQVTGNEHRRSSSGSYVEFATTIASNGPSVPEFDPSLSLKAWIDLGHKLVQVEVDSEVKQQGRMVHRKGTFVI
jgi:hypothetical protein